MRTADCQLLVRLLRVRPSCPGDRGLRPDEAGGIGLRLYVDHTRADQAWLAGNREGSPVVVLSEILTGNMHGLAGHKGPGVHRRCWRSRERL